MAPKFSTKSSKSGVSNNDNGKIDIDIKDNTINKGYVGSGGKDNASEWKSVYSETDDDPTINTEEDIGGPITCSAAMIPNQLQVAFENYTNQTSQILITMPEWCPNKFPPPIAGTKWM